jgi:hypothetical protein
VCPAEIAIFSTEPSFLSGVTEYKWDKPSDWTYLGGQGTKFLDLAAPNYSGFGGGSVVLWVRNRCGMMEGTPSVRYVQENYYSCYGGYSLTASPNPASDELQVSVQKEGADYPETSTSSAEEFEIALYDQFSKARKSGKTGKGKLNLDVRSLPEGVYFLHATRGKINLRKQVLIRRSQ